jgi:predicted  nucleic acid-binding Zn-ribbon protein
MSTLTKILIVLLALLSVYLCSSVVIYVMTATNYKQAYESLQTEHSALVEKNSMNEQQVIEKTKQIADLSNKLDSQIASLKSDKAKIEQELASVTREKKDLDEKVQTLATAALGFKEEVGNMQTNLTQTRNELEQARAESIKLNKNLDEITQNLDEKKAQLEAADNEKKRLLEEKSKLENQLAGKPSTFEPVTSTENGPAVKAVEVGNPVAIQGKVTNLQGNVATISVGSADGVEKGMVFHVTQNDNFICDIKVTDVDTEVAAGALELVQQQPRIGDPVSTTW